MDCQLAHLAVKLFHVGWLLAALLGCMDGQLAHLAGCLLRCWAAWIVS
jgi:hypothetical protein